MIRVAIYDDNLQRCESLQALLALTEGFECVGVFHDCSRVLDDMQTMQPNVVLMDIEMPHVNGINGVALIKKQFPEIKIVMQTVFDDDEKIFASLQAGAEGYILKKASAEKITQSIEEVYMGGAYMTPSVALRVMKHFNHHQQQNKSYNLTSKEKKYSNFFQTA